jgi:predicted RNA-binding protein YlqC (UPF0109 family)
VSELTSVSCCMYVYVCVCVCVCVCNVAAAISAVSGSFKLSLWVPAEAVGKVIGKKGAVIQHIQRESGALCAIVSEDNKGDRDRDRDRDKKGEGDKKGGASLWSPIVITATPSKARAAHDMILDVVEGE